MTVTGQRSCPGFSQPGPFQGVFIPSLIPFTMTLPSGFGPCSGSFDDGALYVWSDPTGQIWRAVLPTGPLPTYPACPHA